MNKKQKAILLMVLTACLWSIGGIFIKLISWNPLLIAGGRSLISGTVMFLYMRYARIRFNICRYSLLAGVGLGASATLFVIANKLTTAANAIVLQYTAPIFILIISAVFLKQKLHLREITVVLTCMLGIFLFFMDQLSPGNILGNFLAILAGFFLALMFVMVGQGGDDDSIRMSGILIAHTIVTIIGIICLCFGQAAITNFTGSELLYLVILGVFQLGIPYVLYAIASKDCPPLACSLIGMLEPLFNPVWVALFLGEIPGKFALLGAVIIIAAISWWCIQESRAVETK